MTAYYNEIDPYAAEWLRNLMRAGHIAPGDIDTRSIEDVHPDDLRGYTQCHFFAGIGVWSYALRQAGWPDDRPSWSGSCPCQPFSAAGKRAGFDDEWHLWPAWFHLIEQCRPPVVFGEQVASKDGLAWLDLVQDDLESTGYAFGAVDTCAAGFGAPHIRQRLYWVAYNAGLEGRRRAEERAIERAVGAGGVAGGVGNANGERRDRQHTLLRAEETGRDASDLPEAPRTGDIGQPRPTNGVWRDADWLLCRDGKWRPVEPGSFPLAHGAPSRVGRLRAYGNAIVAPQAAEFIRAFMSCEVTASTGEAGDGARRPEWGVSCV